MMLIEDSQGGQSERGHLPYKGQQLCSTYQSYVYADKC